MKKRKTRPPDPSSTKLAGEEDDLDDHAGPEQPRKKKSRKPKHRKVPQGYDQTVTIKSGLLGVLVHQPAREVINKLVTSQSKWSSYCSILLHLHATRLLDSTSLSLRAKIDECAKMGQTTIDQAFALVSLLADQLPCKDSDTELVLTYTQHFLPIFALVDTPVPRTKAAQIICTQARVQYLTAAKNSVMTNFESRTKRWIRVQLLRWWLANGLAFKIPTKAALGTTAYRLFTNIRDFVATTDEVIAKCGDLLKVPLTSMTGFAHCVRTAIVEVARRHLPSQPVDETILKAQWGRFLPWFHTILKDCESWLSWCQSKASSWTQDYHNRLVRGVRLFDLLPQHDVGMRHIRLTNPALRYMGCELDLWTTKLSISEIQQDPNKYWGQMFDFEKHGKRRPSLLPAYGLMTDGICASLNYAIKGQKPKDARTKKIERAQAKKAARAADPDSYGVCSPRLSNPEGTTVVGLDPGRNDLYFTVAKGADGKRDEHHFSKSRYRCIARFKGRAQRALEKKLTWSEPDAPWESSQIVPAAVNANLSTKTASMELLIRAWHLRQPQLAQEWGVAERPFHRRLKFDSFIGRQQAISAMARSLILHYRPPKQKPTTVAELLAPPIPPIIIAFGSGRFSGAPTKRFHHHLKTQCKQDCIVVDVAENYTSQRCPKCHKLVGEVYRKPKPAFDEGKEEKKESKEEKKEAKVKRGKKSKEYPNCAFVYGLKACPSCSLVFNRDSMGAENILAAWKSIQKTGVRPKYLCRPECPPTKTKDTAIEWRDPRYKCAPAPRQ